jgi:hypothetical protein
MIIVRIAGGLANQMVTYTAGRALAVRHNTDLKLDLSLYKKDKLRSYALHNLNIQAEIASEQDMNTLMGCYRIKPLFKIRKKAHKLLKTPDMRFYKEPRNGGFDPNFFKLQDNVYIKGEFLSRRYNEPIADLLKQDFTIKPALSQTTKKMLDQINGCTSISIHIRRGDYVEDTKTNAFHGALPLNYYQQAMQMLSRKIDQPVFFVFSDNIAWVKDNLSSKHEIIFVDHTNDDNAYEDMYMMSRCQHNIIANSGLSFWGGWLNEHADKIVIAPKQWFRNQTFNQNFDLLPADWLRI